MPNDKPPTMKDVAEYAKVTQPTVSYVINGTARISPKVTKRVREAIDALGYEPNALAKGLKQRETKTVGIILPDIGNGFYATIACAAESVLAKSGYISFISSTLYDAATEKLFVTSLMRHSVAGVITYPFFDPSLYELLRKHSMPTVIIDGTLDLPNTQCICIDSEKGGLMATEYLIGRGRSRIAFASEPFVIQTLRERLTGYEGALQNAGIPLKPEYLFIEEREYDKFEMGYKLGGRILKQDVDGVFATSDYIAYGILRRLKEAGIKVPEDVSVVGFDNTPLSPLSVPSLTTIAQPIGNMAQSAAGLLLNMIKKLSEPGPSILLPPELIIRET